MEDKNLSDYQKGCGPETNRRAVEILRELDITLHAALMVNPDFEAADFIKLRENLKALAPAEFSFTVFSPPPGTPLWDEYKEQLVCADPYAFYDCMHTLLPTRMPLNKFYRAFSLLYLMGFRYNPWRARHVRAPLRDLVRLLVSGARCGRALRTIYKDYDRSRW